MKSKKKFKKVPALEKCFNILDLLSKNRGKIGISEIAETLDYHKSTVYNIVNTLSELGIIEQNPDNKINLGPRLYSLGRSAGSSSQLISIVHPYLEKIHNKLDLSVYLGVLVQDTVLTIDKVESPIHLRVSSDIGLSTHILTGAIGKVVLSKMPDDKIEEIFSRYSLRKYTHLSITSKRIFLEMVKKARLEGYAYSDQEYIEGIRAIAVPLNNYGTDTITAIYVLGLNSQIKDDDVGPFSVFLMKTAKSIDDRIAMA